MLTLEYVHKLIADGDPRDPDSRYGPRSETGLKENDRRKFYEKPVASPMSREDAEMLVDFKGAIRK